MIQHDSALNCSHRTHRRVVVKRSSSEAALSSAFVISARSCALSSRSFSLALVALSRPRRSLSMSRAAYSVGSNGGSCEFCLCGQNGQTRTEGSFRQWRKIDKLGTKMQTDNTSWGTKLAVKACKSNDNKQQATTKRHHHKHKHATTPTLTPTKTTNNKDKTQHYRNDPCTTFIFRRSPGTRPLAAWKPVP